MFPPVIRSLVPCCCCCWLTKSLRMTREGGMESVTYTLSLGEIAVVIRMPVRVVYHTAMMAPTAS